MLRSALVPEDKAPTGTGILQILKDTQIENIQMNMKQF